MNTLAKVIPSKQKNTSKLVNPTFWGVNLTFWGVNNFWPVLFSGFFGLKSGVKKGCVLLPGCPAEAVRRQNR
jgi:hypothetical protein